MILLLKPNTDKNSEAYHSLLDMLKKLNDVQTRVHDVEGDEKTLTEIYLLGNTSALLVDEMQDYPCVERVIRISDEYRILGRHADEHRASSFEYNGVKFGQDSLHVFAGLCAVDNPEHVELMMKA